MPHLDLRVTSLWLQVALEGAVNAKLAQSSLARGELPQGDLIPWTIGQQYQVQRYFGGFSCAQ
jgi:tRNA(Met) C34 N-acetyltransferase TmcA